MIKFNNTWDNVLKDEFEKEYYKKLRGILKKEYSTQTIFPDMNNIFNALKLTDYKDVRIVILGQDPYHNVGQAHGLSFSVMDGITPPPSLKNIYKEIEQDLGLVCSNSGNLTKWSNQGVLLLNAVLTVRKNQPNSHKGIGWETFTDNIISLLNETENKIVFILWGNYAKVKASLITNENHLILTASHPSPFSAHNGFFGCKHFSKANDFLVQNNILPIDWKI